ISTNPNQTAHQSSFFQSELTPLLMIRPDSQDRPFCSSGQVFVLSEMLHNHVRSIASPVLTDNQIRR
ncbi:MAG: hypothetical protein JSW58_04795, partial [Candidatus Latescibacterota bacterium]